MHLESLVERGDGDGAGASAATLEDLEIDALNTALAEVGGNRRRAAERLGIGLRTLSEKLKRFDVG